MSERSPAAEPEWRVRAYREGDAAGILGLFHSVFRKTMTEAEWRWKLHTLPSPAENEWVAVARERIVGHYAATPVRFQVDGEIVVVPHGCDAMTLPEYRRRGILYAVCQRANEVWEQTRAPFQIGFHYGGWGSVRERLGWRPVVRLVWMRRILSLTGLVQSRLGLPRTRRVTFANEVKVGEEGQAGYRITQVSQAGPEFDRLWEAAGPGYRYLAVRDRAWVQWRYLDQPGSQQEVWLAQRGGEPCGYVAVRVWSNPTKNWAVLLDTFAAAGDRETLQALLRSTGRALAARGVVSISALAVEGSPRMCELERAGFARRPYGFDFSTIPYHGPEPSRGPGDWLVTGAEGDVT